MLPAAHQPRCPLPGPCLGPSVHRPGEPLWPSRWQSGLRRSIPSRCGRSGPPSATPAPAGGQSGGVPFTPHLSTPSQHRATPGVRLAFLEGTDMKCPGQCQPGGGRRDFRRQRCPAQLPLAAGASHPRRGGPVPQASWAATVRSTPRPSFRSPPAAPGPASLVTPSPQPAPFFLPSKLPGPCPIAPPHTHTHCRGHRQAPGQVH